MCTEDIPIETLSSYHDFAKHQMISQYPLSLSSYSPDNPIIRRANHDPDRILSNIPGARLDQDPLYRACVTPSQVRWCFGRLFRMCEALHGDGIGSLDLRRDERPCMVQVHINPLPVFLVWSKPPAAARIGCPRAWDG